MYHVFHKQRAKSREKTTSQGALFEILSISLPQCISPHTRSQYIFGKGLLDIQQFQSAFRSKITWNYIFEVTNCRRIILIFFLLEERSLFRNRSMVSSRNSSLSPTGNRGRFVTRPNFGCERDYSKRGTDAFYFCPEEFRKKRQ